MTGGNGAGDTMERLKEEIEKLPLEDKARLVQEVLSSSGLQVVMGGGNFISADVVLQIQNGSAEQLAGIFRALASRVKNEKNESP